MSTRRASRLALPFAILVSTALALSGCSASSDADRSPGTEAAPTIEVLSELELTDRTFWWGDALGSLFEVNLDRAQVRTVGNSTEVHLTGSAQNLSPTATSLELSGSTPSAEATGSFSGGTDGPVEPQAKADVVVTIPDVAPDQDLNAIRLVLGEEGTNQVVIPLGPDPVETGPAPQSEVVPESSIELAPGADLTVTGSTLYPRYGTGRAGQYRLQVLVTVSVGGTDPNQVLMLHPSITDPEGNEASLGDQVAIEPETQFVEGAVLNELIAGAYRLEVLEVSTDTMSAIPFDLG